MTAPLSFEELVAPKRAEGQTLSEYYGHRRAILGPADIPIHPSVSELTQVYSHDFADTVVASLPDALRRDIETIERLLSVDLGIRVTDEGVADAAEVWAVAFDGDGAMAVDVTDGTGLALARGSTSIWLDRRESNRTEYMLWAGMEHPMSLDRLREYGAEGGSLLRAPVWHNRDVTEQGEPVYHLLRAFAIQFNNLGLELAS